MNLDNVIELIPEVIEKIRNDYVFGGGKRCSH